MLVGAAAIGVGLITGFFGVGGGLVIVPALVLVLGFDMPVAAAISLVVIAIDAAAALAVRAAHGGLALNWAVTVIFAAASPAYPNVFAAGIAFAAPHAISLAHTSPNGTLIAPAPPRTGMPSEATRPNKVVWWS